MNEINLDLHQVLYQSLKDHDETIKRYIEMQLVKTPLQDIFDQLILTKINSMTESMIIQNITELNKNSIVMKIENRLNLIFKKLEFQLKKHLKTEKFRDDVIKTIFKTKNK